MNPIAIVTLSALAASAAFAAGLAGIIDRPEDRVALLMRVADLDAARAWLSQPGLAPQAKYYAACAGFLNAYAQIERRRAESAAGLLRDLDRSRDRAAAGGGEKAGAQVERARLEALLNDTRTRLRELTGAGAAANPAGVEAELKNYEEFAAVRRSVDKAMADDEEARRQRETRLDSLESLASQLRWIEFQHRTEAENGQVLALSYRARAERVERGIARGESLAAAESAIRVVAADAVSRRVETEVPDWTSLQDEMPADGKTDDPKKIRSAALKAIKRRR
jgi:hypothetical protein